MTNFKNFDFDKSVLTDEEKKVLHHLKEAARKVAPLYEKQKKPGEKRAAFYPENVSKEKIEKQAEKNSNLLGPYTFVEEKNGKLKAVKFKDRFKKELKEIRREIDKAAKASSNKEFKNYLKEMGKSLLQDDYARNEMLWVTSPLFKFSFIIGPIERYLDRLFFKKCAYQSWLGVIDEERTKEAEKFKQIILAARRKILSDAPKVRVPSLRVEVNKTVCFAGLIADNMFTGTNLPNSMELMEKRGSKLTIFSGSLREKFEKDQLPVFKKIFPEKIKKEYSEDELYEGTLRCILLHEISHSLIRYEDAEERLGSIFPVFDEALAYILGIKACGHLIFKKVLTQKELRSILLLHIVRNFVWYQDFKENSQVEDYARGAALTQRFYEQSGALWLDEKGKVNVDFKKLFSAVEKLSGVLEHYLSSGNLKEAENFVKSQAGFEVFDKYF